jgi:Ras family protein A
MVPTLAGVEPYRYRLPRQSRKTDHTSHNLSTVKIKHVGTRIEKKTCYRRRRSMWKDQFVNVIPLPATLCDIAMFIQADLLRRVFQKGEFPEDHAPTVFDTYVQDVYVPPDNKPAQLALWDTAGQEEYDRLRPLCYPDTSIILICFSLDNFDSLENVVEKWQPEVLQYTGHLRIPYILVGTKRDLRGRRGEGVSSLEGEAIARRIGARGYVECSARFNEGVQEVFQFAAREACREPYRKKPGLSCNIV